MPSKDDPHFKDKEQEVITEKDKLRKTLFTDKKKSTFKLKGNFDKVLKSLQLNKISKDVLKARSLKQLQQDKQNEVDFNDSLPEQDERLRAL